MDHNAALDDKHSLADFWHCEQGNKLVAVMVSSMYENEWKGAEGTENEDAMLDTMTAKAEEMIQRLALATRRSECYYIAGSIQDMLYAAQESLPKGTGRPDFLPSEYGYVRFERPIKMLGLAEGKEQGQRRQLEGLMWLPGPKFSYPDAKTGEYRVGSLMILGLTRAPQRYLPTPSLVEIWPDIRAWDQVDDAHRKGNAEVPIEDLKLVNGLLQTFWCFVDQKLLAMGHLPASRSLRRRVAQANTQAGRPERPQEVGARIVQLRRLVHHANPDAEKREVEWTCQWITRGHWRTYTGKGGRIPKTIWINQYWKGPEDAPIKAPRETVYAVVR